MTVSETRKQKTTQTRLDYAGYFSGMIAVVCVGVYAYTMTHTMSLVGETKEYRQQVAEISKLLPELEEEYYESFTQLQNNLGSYEGLIVPDVVHYVLRKPSRSVASVQ